MASHLDQSVGGPLKHGIQVKIVDLQYQAKNWRKPRRVVAKIEWPRGELFPKIGFVVTKSRLPADKVVKVYNGRADVENRIKEGKNAKRLLKVGTRISYHARKWRVHVASVFLPAHHYRAVLAWGP